MASIRVAGKRERFAWYCYDFGNTAVEFVVALYLGQWLILDRHMPAIMYGSLSAVVSLAVVGSAAHIGHTLERRELVGYGLRVTTLGGGLLIVGLSVIPELRADNGMLLCCATAGPLHAPKAEEQKQIAVFYNDEGDADADQSFNRLPFRQPRPSPQPAGIRFRTFVERQRAGQHEQRSAENIRRKKTCGQADERVEP